MRLAKAIGTLAAISGAAVALAGHVRVPVAPVDNPANAPKVALGRRLFYDADLSVDGTMSCATCHEQHRGFADGNVTHGGVTGAAGRRNVPGLANVGFLPSLTWGDPRIRTLEAQVAVPVTGTHPIEMGMAGHEAEIARRLGADPCYRAMFSAAFPGSGGTIDMARVSQAIASFERSLVSGRTPYDAYLAGHRKALTADAREGLRLFEAHGCAGCHSGPDLTDGAFHAVAPSSPAQADLGLYEITGRSEDEASFRTPSLRNVAVTAPYLHDGSARTIADAIRHHAADTALTGQELSRIGSFLGALTDQRLLRDPHLSLPRQACGRRL